jgi:hypothetical protein
VDRRWLYSESSISVVFYVLACLFFVVVLNLGEETVKVDEFLLFHGHITLYTGGL